MQHFSITILLWGLPTLGAASGSGSVTLLSSFFVCDPSDFWRLLKALIREYSTHSQCRRNRKRSQMPARSRSFVKCRDFYKIAPSHEGHLDTTAGSRTAGPTHCRTRLYRWKWAPVVFPDITEVCHKRLSGLYHHIFIPLLKDSQQVTVERKLPPSWSNRTQSIAM